MIATRLLVALLVSTLSTHALAEDLSRVLILHPDSESATQALTGLRDEVGEDLELISVEFSSAMTVTELDQLLAQTQADALVLMNNPTVELYRKYQETQAEGASFPPAVMMLTSFLEKAASGIQNATGINYEVAAVSSMVNLRNIVKTKVERIGVIYRDIFEDFIQEQASMAAQEKIRFVTRRIRSGQTHRELKPLLRQL